MKIRNGFVSNSSSSSFIVIGRDGLIPNTRLDYNFVIGESGACEFGWDHCQYSGVDTRINFAYLQAAFRYRGIPSFCREWMDMLNKVLKKHGAINRSCVLSPNYGEDYEGRYAYIDHQSAAYEGQNDEMFDSEEDLERFIFCPGSYIQGGNDNE